MNESSDVTGTLVLVAMLASTDVETLLSINEALVNPRYGFGIRFSTKSMCHRLNGSLFMKLAIIPAAL